MSMTDDQKKQARREANAQYYRRTRGAAVPEARRGRGRPRKYATIEEARAAATAQRRANRVKAKLAPLCAWGFHVRLRDEPMWFATMALREAYLTANPQREEPYRCQAPLADCRGPVFGPLGALRPLPAEPLVAA